VAIGSAGERNVTVRNAKKAQRSLFKVEEEEYNHEFYASNNEDE